MATASSSSIPIKMVYNEMEEIDKNTIIELASNALKDQEKSEKTLYFKDLAEIIKNDLDSSRGY
jgi:hypothetical protein